MRFRYTEQPALDGDLDEIVEALWETSILAAGTYVVLPDGRMDLVARCEIATPGDERVASVAIIGPSSRPSRIPVESTQWFLGARYSPGFGACLGVTPSAIVDEAVRGDGVHAALGADLDSLMQARGRPRIRAAFRALASRRASMAAALPGATRIAIERLHGSAGKVTIRELASMTCTPERSLRRHVQQAIGLPPKTFAGILRFHKAMRLINTDPAPALADVAAACGYSDQAHLTRECQRFGGFTPGQRLPATLVTMPLGSLAD